MPRFAANLSLMFNEYPFVERFDRAALAGFQAVEFMFPYQEDIPAVRDAIQRNGLTNALFNMPPGDWVAGDRGTANDPRRREEFRDGVEKALEIATLFGTEKLNCLAGLKLSDFSLDEQFDTLKESLVYAADRATEAGVKLVFEPINRFDIPGFYLSGTTQALSILDEVGMDNAFVQYDIYHMQRMEGELAATMHRQVARIGHVQLADNPGRNEPGTGEINYAFLFAHLDAIGYQGHIGCEYKPATTTEAGLGWRPRPVR